MLPRAVDLTNTLLKRGKRLKGGGCTMQQLDVSAF